MINSVIKTQFGTVIVFDRRGCQIPKYQGEYQKVKDAVLKNAPAGAMFSQEAADGKIQFVARETW